MLLRFSLFGERLVVNIISVQISQMMAFLLLSVHGVLSV